MFLQNEGRVEEKRIECGIQIKMALIYILTMTFITLCT